MTWLLIVGGLVIFGTLAVAAVSRASDLSQSEEGRPDDWTEHDTRPENQP